MLLAYIINIIYLFKMKKVLKKVVAVGTILQAASMHVFAVASDFFIQNIDSTTGEGNLIGWVQKVLNLVIALTGLIAVAFLVYSGVTYITAAGDETKVEKATQGVVYSVVGLIIAFISVMIVNFILDRVIVQ